MRSIPLNGTLVIGQDQDDILKGFNKYQSYSGDVTLLGMWDEVLKPEQVWASFRYLFDNAEEGVVSLRRQWCIYFFVSHLFSVGLASGYNEALWSRFFKKLIDSCIFSLFLFLRYSFFFYCVNFAVYYE